MLIGATAHFQNYLHIDKYTKQNFVVTNKLSDSPKKKPALLALFYIRQDQPSNSVFTIFLAGVKSKDLVFILPTKSKIISHPSYDARLHTDPPLSSMSTSTALRARQ